MSPIVGVAAVAFALDGAAWIQRMHQRRVLLARATARARGRRKPLLIVGAPGGWSTAERSALLRHGCGDPGAGDVVVDLVPAPECPRNYVRANIEDLGRFPRGAFGAVFVSCVLEHVEDIQRAWRELKRVCAGPDGRAPIYAVLPQPWSPFAWWCSAHRWAILGIADGRIHARRLRP